MNGSPLPPAEPPPATKPGDEQSPFYVPAFLDLLGGLVHRYRDWWLALGRLESRLLEDELRQVNIRNPIFICGLARSGSTLLHEVVSAHPGVATHRVRDYPMVFTPYWWRQATANVPLKPPRERAHQDRVMITGLSPDALEEMIWMAFFPRCHDPAVSNVLGADTRHPAFEAFYRNHLRKLLLAEGATRYAAKANYHVARLAYLVRLFPDARLLIPVRTPAGHVGSLMRQQARFAAGHRKYPRALRLMRRAGHFEFGLDRRPINLGDDHRVRQVRRAWAAGEEVRGLALYWDMVHGYLARLLAADDRVRAAGLVVPFEAMCAAPAETLRAVCRHCLLPDAERVVEQFAPRISQPDYYESGLTPADREIIRQETANTARLWGYEA